MTICLRNWHIIKYFANERSSPSLVVVLVVVVVVVLPILLLHLTIRVDLDGKSEGDLGMSICHEIYKQTRLLQEHLHVLNDSLNNSRAISFRL